MVRNRRRGTGRPTEWLVRDQQQRPRYPDHMSPNVQQPAVVLVSGGLDSATVLAIAREEGYASYALSFDYGQRHRHELDAARKVCAASHVAQHCVVSLDLRVFGGSALTADINVPKDREQDAMSDGIPVTYVPARNTIFLSIALGWAEVLGAFDIFHRSKRGRLQRLSGLPVRNSSSSSSASRTWRPKRGWKGRAGFASTRR